MFTNNKFAKMDSIANLVKNILEADTKAKMEELKGNQHKIDKNKNNKIDAHDFAILRGQKKGMKEETEQVDEASHQAKTTMKHIDKPTAGEKKAAKDIKPGVAGYRDRIAMLKSAEARGALKKEEAEQVDEARVKGKGYDNPENERKAPEGHVSMTSLMPGHDERAAKFLARQAKGKLVKGKAQSAPQKEETDPNKTTTDTLKGREKSSSNPFLSKKVMMDVPDNVKEEIEQIDELKVSTLLRYATKANKALIGGDRSKEDKRIKGIQTSRYKIQKQAKKIKEEVEELDEAVALSDAKTTAERLVKKTIATHGIANPRTASDHAKNAHAIEKTLHRASVARSPIHLAHAHSDVKSVTAATRRHNVALNMSGAERKAHKTLQAGVVKHLQNHLDQHKQAFQNAAAKYASKNKTNEEYTIEDIENFMQTEEYQQLDELSKNLLSRYKKAAAKDQHDAFDKDNKLGIEHQKVKRLMANTNKGAPGMRGANPISKTNAPAVHKALSKASDEIQKMRDPHQARFAKRRSGMELATKKMGIGAGSRGVVRGTGKLNKEEVELNERTLTKPETAEKERIVKGMKKSLAGFKSRYGEKAKSVMYATATARAKEKK